MSSLADAVNDPRHHVAVWLRENFPHNEAIQEEFRRAAGPTRVIPARTVTFGTQNIAIDWWIRLLIDPVSDLRMALNGVMMTRGGPGYDAGMELLLDLGAVDDSGRLQPINPKRFTDRDDSWWARTCYALAVLVRCGRGETAAVARIAALPSHSGAGDLLALANRDEVSDLKEVRRLAAEHLVSALPRGRAITGATFDGSRDLGANADVVVAGTLLDIKTTVGTRDDDTRRHSASLSRADIDKLLGYLLLDYSNSHRLTTVGVYDARSGRVVTWPLNRFCAQLAAGEVDLARSRTRFKHRVRGGLRTRSVGKRTSRFDVRSLCADLPSEAAHVMRALGGPRNETSLFIEARPGRQIPPNG